jgi:hypothetical protein
MEWQYVIELAKEINLAQLVIIGLMFWFFYSRLDGKINKLDEKINKLDEKVDDVDKRLCRIEGSLASQGHCLFSQNQAKEKAQ